MVRCNIFLDASGEAACDTLPDPDTEPEELVVADLDGAVLFRRPIPALLGPPLVEDLHLYVTLPGGVRSFGLGIYNHPLRTSTRLQVRIKAWQEVE